MIKLTDEENNEIIKRCITKFSVVAELKKCVAIKLTRYFLHFELRYFNSLK